ncbi:MAG TPA: efflux RND transporter periplasmic adaptor subunit [Candidatus Angelobacter sp.]|jgi:RND family efflux transporter MFP subunit
MKIESRVWTHSDHIDEKPQRPVAAPVSRTMAEVRWETRVKYPLLLALAACVLAFCGCAEEVSSATAKPVEKPVEVNGVHPHRGEVSRFINLPGEVRPLYEVTLFAKVDGYLDKLTVDKGDSVKAGDLIADIDVPELRANLVKYKAELELAQAEFKQMSEGTADSEAAKNRLAVASGKLAVAKGNVQYTESMLKYARVVAPFSGIITKRYVDPGAYIPVPNAASTPEAAAIVNLTDFKTVRLQVAVPETEATHVKIGQSIRWTADDFPGEHFDGTVTRAYWALDKATKTMLTETQIANPGMKLQPGMLVNARIGIEKKSDALLLPAEALVKEKTNSFIFIFNDGKLKKAPVQVGFNDGTNVEIVAGVKPADLAIVPGQQTLRDGQLVKVMEEKLVKIAAAK